MRLTRTTLYAALFAIVGGAAACDQTADLGVAPTVQQQELPSVVYSKVNKRLIKLLGVAGPSSTMTFATPNAITPKGAVLQFGRFTLEVQKNSVSRPTFFAATVSEGSTIVVDLKAWDLSGPVTMFRTPVLLTIDLDDLDLDDDEMRTAVVVYLNPDGSYERVPTTVDDDGEKITGVLGHFSEYSPGTQRADTAAAPN